VKNVAETGGGGAGTDLRTRDRVLSLLLELGPSTAAVLSERAGLSSAGVRRHLDALVAEGTVSTRSPRLRSDRGRGRPARVYALTDAGHAAGPSAYDDLAASALRFLAEQAGPDAVERFAQARVADLERRYADRLEGLSAQERPGALAAALSDDGYAASTSPLPRPDGRTGLQLCQHHCPVQHVARDFPQLCDAETAAIGRLLGAHVQRLATIAHGDGVCTTYVPSGTSTPVPPGTSTPVPPGTTTTGTTTTGTTTPPGRDA
jgi:predicted ArsR family transcriptional regulator